jgi:hypothetical protein
VKPADPQPDASFTDGDRLLYRQARPAIRALAAVLLDLRARQQAGAPDYHTPHLVNAEKAGSKKL